MIDDYVTVIKSYLAVDAKPVTLPERDKVEIGKTRKTGSYPPLILDGASGVGKTQQAFALLKVRSEEKTKTRYQLVYLCLAGPNDRQAIYTAMTQLFGFNGYGGYKSYETLVKFIDAVVNQMRRNGTATDPLSIESIDFQYTSCKDYQNNSPLYDFVEFLHSRVIEYDEDNEYIKKAENDTLEGKVLFVDEALPDPEQQEPGNKGTPTAKDRLKLLRNLGRVLKMRVVLAGTAATAANMWTPKRDSASAASSFGKKNFIWAEVEFLYRLVSVKKIEDQKKEDPKKGSIKYRPLLYKWLREDDTLHTSLHEDGNNDLDIGSIVTKLGCKKEFTDESIFVWLSGACLSADENTPTPFHLKPSALVRGHFFEPSLATCAYRECDDSTTENQIIHTGQGFGKISRVIRPLRLKIIKCNNGNDKYWCLKEEKVLKEEKARREELLPPAFSLDYSFIEYALTNCVQVCLAQEPLFAFCVSVGQELEHEEFEEAIRKALPETKIQRSKGGLDGELHEQIIFAALQLSVNDFSCWWPRTLKESVDQLYEYLSIANEKKVRKYNVAAKYFSARSDMVVKRKTQNNDRKITFEYNAELGDNALDEDIEEEAKKAKAEGLFEKEQMPWLVPACKKEMLKEKIDAYGENYFGYYDVAGLVPGVVNARMDAEAIRWNGETDWEFEFRARANSYSIEAAMKDLMKKMTKTGTPNGEGGQKDSHGMLIAITNTIKSRCEYFVIKQEEKYYFRVVVLIGNADA